MELIANNPQVFVTLVVVLVAGAIAIFCDFLRRNNDQLREVNIELRVRHQEETAKVELLKQVVTSAPALMAAAAVGPAALPAPATATATATLPAPAPAPAHAAMERAAEFTSRRGRRARTEAPVEEAPVAAAAEINAGQSLAEARMLAREFMGRAAVRAGHNVTAPKTASAPVVQQPEVIIEQPKKASVAAPARKDWNKILNASMRRPVPETVEVTAEPKRGGELIPFERFQNEAAAVADSTMPEGFQEAIILARLLTAGKTINGLAMVIGINDFAARRQANGALGTEALVASLCDHFRSILKPGEFACQSNNEEFLIINTAVRDASSSRRVNEIAESLWAFQLNTVGTTNILLSWGSFEAKGETLADVLSAAGESMRETRRNRRSHMIEQPLQKAV